MKHFSIDEFRCSCCDKEEMRESTLTMLDKAREIAGVPFVITSGYRCEEHNRNVGGSPTSSHLYGWAVDIQAQGDRNRFAILQGLVKAGFTRIGIAKNFIHADNDPQKSSGVSWLY